MGACGSTRAVGVADPSAAPPASSAEVALSRSCSSSSPPFCAEGRTRNRIRAQLVLDRSGCIHDAYEVEAGKPLGEGSHGVVHLGTRRSTGVARAIKTVVKKQMHDVNEFRREVETMKQMDHPNIIKLYETYEDAKNVYLVMELCRGGELFDRIVEAGCFTEHEAAVVMQQILRAVFYMHENSMAHRDLKPENFLFLTKEPIESNVLKLIDFGLACRCPPRTVLKATVGTPQYIAPQVLSKRYDKRCDLWSCGVIMFTLLSGRSPFGGRTDREVLERVRQGVVSLNGRAWDRISPDAKHLVGMLLRRSPKERYSAEQALNHVWIKDTAPRAPDLKLADCFLDGLRDYCSQNKLKKAALQVIADQLGEGHTRRLRDTFNALDRSGNGVLTLADLKDGLARAGLSDKAPDLEEILKGIDVARSGSIDYTEFLAATLHRSSALQDDLCWTAFNVFDHDGDGKICQKELLRMLDSGSTTAYDSASGQSSQGASRPGSCIDEDDYCKLNFEDFLTIVRTDSQHSTIEAVCSSRSLGEPAADRRATTM